MVSATSAAADAGPVIDLVYETGPAYVAQNDGRYGDAGTRYQADDVGQRDVLARTERGAVELGLGRHRVIALYAPFFVATRVTLADELRFRDTTFAAGTVVLHDYRFDGFRASYLYQALTGCLSVEVGGSLQIRSADVAFAAADGSQADHQSDIGLVPAAKVRVTYRPGPTWARLEADGLSTFGLVGDTSGGIYDVAVAVGRTVRPGLDVFADVRLLGGGAEVPAQAIDNWANYLSAALGIRWRIGG